MRANGLNSLPKGNGIYNTEPYHLEKYVIPGAVAVGFLFIFPWYLLGGEGFGGIDLGAAIIAVLVVGHVIESLKVYQWGSQVRVNFNMFNAKIEGLLLANELERDAVNRAKALLFVKLNPSEISGFAWNLVRWQKMTVFAVLLWISTFEWLLFAAMAILEEYQVNPFAATFKLAILKNEITVWSSVVSEVTLAIVIFLTSLGIYKYGLDRQIRNNNFFFELFQKYRDSIVTQLKSSTSSG
jgi:hypothetical protein